MTSEEPEAPNADDGHHEAFDPEPIKQLPPDEPKTPLWLPALGLAFFVAFGLYLAIGGDDEEDEGEAAAKDEATAAPTAAGTARAGGDSGARTAAPIDRLDPEERRRLRKRLRRLQRERAK